MIFLSFHQKEVTTSLTKSYKKYGELDLGRIRLRLFGALKEYW